MGFSINIFKTSLRTPQTKCPLRYHFKGVHDFKGLKCSARIRKLENSDENIIKGFKWFHWCQHHFIDLLDITTLGYQHTFHS